MEWNGWPLMTERLLGIAGILLLLLALFRWLKPGRPAPKAEIEPIDEAELAAAEREVQDLDIHQRPEDGFEGDDWGPGAAGRR